MHCLFRALTVHIFQYGLCQANTRMCFEAVADFECPDETLRALWPRVSLQHPFTESLDTRRRQVLVCMLMCRIL